MRKLAGFGPNPDGSRGCRPGVSVVEASSSSASEERNSPPEEVQLGITPGSFVTAVGWDADRGTEGSTKRIVLGTSHGELYEYSLSGPGGPSDAPPGGGRSRGPPGGGGADPSDPADGPLDAPVLLRRLNTNPVRSGVRPDGGAVGGVLLRRLSPSPPGPAGGRPATASAGARLAVLAATGGPGRRTRLHTFARSGPAGPCAVRSAFAGGPGGGAAGGTYVELPGSVDSADLVGCPADGTFALRTETGIYRGSVERVAFAGSSGGANGRAADPDGDGAGLLTYGSLRAGPPGPGGRAPAAPSSAVATPHHLVCLHPGPAADEVRFVSRAGRRTVQAERVDWSPGGGDGGGPRGVRGPSSRGAAARAEAELVADARRPDQVWLRRGWDLVHISSGREDRDVWRYTLERCAERSAAEAGGHRSRGGGSGRPASPNDGGGEEEDDAARRARADEARFDHARSLCSTTTEAAVADAVRAEVHLARGRARLAASYMARCPPALVPFDAAALRLASPALGRDGPRNKPPGGGGPSDAPPPSDGALAAYLDDRIRRARGRGDRVACTALGAWLAELHLCERGTVLPGGGGAGSDGPAPAAAARTALLRQHLSSYVRDMDPATILGILEGHDVGAGEVAGYAAAAGDVGAAVEAALGGDDGKVSLSIVFLGKISCVEGERGWVFVCGGYIRRSGNQERDRTAFPFTPGRPFVILISFGRTYPFSFASIRPHPCTTFMPVLPARGGK